MHPRLRRGAFALALLALLAGCARGPAPAGLPADVQARLDGLFGRPVLAVQSLRRQGSAPHPAAADGSRQVVVYFNAVLRFVEAYDPSDWEGLNPALIARALGATDEGILGLGAGRHEPGAELRSFGSIVYRRGAEGWTVAEAQSPRVAPAAADGRGTVAQGRADELIRRLEQLVRQSPRTRGTEREIIAQELDRALQIITLRLQNEDTGIAVAGGPLDGEYWRFLSSLVRGLPDGAQIAVAASPGSVANALMLESGSARFGIVQSDVAAAAVTGQGAFAPTGPLVNLRAAASLFPEPVHVVVRADSPFVRLEDLAGRRVAVGEAASGSRHTAMRLLAHAGVDAGQLALLDQGSAASALERLAAGEIDAVIAVASAPWQQFESAARATPLRLLGIDAEAAARIAADVHGLVPLGIPARTYPGQEEAVPTVAATALLVVRGDVADASVEATLGLLYAVAAERGGVLAARLSRERALAGVTIPLHPGARRFLAAGGAGGAS
jgi:TRAP transporter TAXI family solute receptor